MVSPEGSPAVCQHKYEGTALNLGREAMGFVLAIEWAELPQQH